MKYRRLVLFYLFIMVQGYAQTGKPIAPVQSFKFGQISRAEMTMDKHPTDPDAQAIILFDIGSNSLDISTGFSSHYKLHRRIKILTESAAREWSNIFVNYGDGDLKPKIKASVFTLNTDSSIAEVKLDSKDIFTEKVLKRTGWSRLRATLPKVGVGSIIEYEYSVTNNEGLSWRSWVFQHNEPSLISQFTFSPPALVFFNHLILGSLSPRVSNDGGNSTYTIINVPALREQPYTSNIDNYRSAVKFRLTQAGTFKIHSTWNSLFRDLLQTSDFSYYTGGGVYKDISKPLVSTAKDKQEIIKNLYEHVTSTMSWDSSYSFIPNPSPRKLIDKKSGNSAALNMYMLNLLKEADIKTDMILVSTRSNGLVGTTEPFVNQYNHIMLRAFITDSTYLFLDCTDKTLPYNLLSDDCLFISGFIIKQGPAELVTSYPQAGESEMLLANMNIAADGKVSADITCKYKHYSASQKRNQLNGKVPSDWVKQAFFKDQPTADITNASVEGLTSINADLVVKGTFSSTEHTQVVNEELYLNPLLMGRVAETPFKLEKRTYPVDIILGIDRNIIVNLAIPEGWVLADALKSIGVTTPNKKALFRRTIELRGNQLSIRFRLQVAAGSYPVNEYADLRDFYDRLVKTMAEQIVIKKKS